MHTFKVIMVQAYGPDFNVIADEYVVEMCGAVSFIGQNETTHAFLTIPPGSWIRIEEVTP